MTNPKGCGEGMKMNIKLDKIELFKAVCNYLHLKERIYDFDVSYDSKGNIEYNITKFKEAKP